MKKILVVDDSPNVVQFLCKSLEGMGYAVNFVVNPLLLFPLLKKEKYDLLLLDFLMPEMNGLEVIKKLKEAQHSIPPVIMITGNRDDNLFEQAFSAGVIDYIIKPFHEIEMRVRIHAALQLQHEKQRYIELVDNIFPPAVAQELLKTGRYESRSFPSATIAFSDFCNFTQTTESWPSKVLVERLEYYFNAFDFIMTRNELERIKTLGDGYMFGSGLSKEDPEHAVKCIRGALEMLDFVQECKKKHQKGELKFSFSARIGVNSGPITAGVLGRNRLAYDIWGDTVNTAHRIESHGMENNVTISKETYKLVSSQFSCKKLGEVEVKSKGKIPIYIVEGGIVDGKRDLGYCSE
ncbi:response regulator [Simkania negevensis]|uniref:Response regulator n=1 Tax=Simkania negevensis TaxID=83561 RepID=A0ABS3ASN8_9BACT|nr:response regulator [Simkania negevensis]